MAKWGWLIWGLIFSVVLFVTIYFLIYRKIAFTSATVVLKFWNMDVSFLRGFLSNIKNVILTSLVLGFLLGAIPGIRFRKKENLNWAVKN
jgi:hypothetical protein